MAKDRSKPPLAKLPELSDAQIRWAMQEGTQDALRQAEYNVRAKLRRLKARGLPLPPGTKEKFGVQTDDSARDWKSRDSDFGNHDGDGNGGPSGDRRNQPPHRRVLSRGG